MAHHVHRATGLGAWVLINENWYKQFAHRRKAVPFRLRARFVDVKDMQGAPRRDGESDRMSESGAVARREVGRVHNGLKGGLVDERGSLVFLEIPSLCVPKTKSGRRGVEVRRGLRVI